METTMTSIIEVADTSAKNMSTVDSIDVVPSYQT